MSNHISLTFSDAKAAMVHVAATGIPIMLRGAHGIGKSAVVKQLAEKMNLPVIEKRAGQMQEGDLIGLPNKAEMDRVGVTSWLPPDWLLRASQEAVMLFLDEIDRGSVEVAQGFFQLGDSRQINGVHLHEDTVIIAATNTGLHQAAQEYSGTRDLGVAEADRWWTIDVEPTHDEWLEYAKDQISSCMWNFHNEHRGSESFLEHKGSSYQANHVYPTRRSWMRLSDTLNAIDQDHTKIDNFLLQNIAIGYVGPAATISYGTYLQNYDRTVSVDDILEDGKFSLLDGWSIPEYNSFVAKMWNENVFQSKLTKKRLDNFIKFVHECCPAEIGAYAQQLLFTAQHQEDANATPFNSDQIAINQYIIRADELMGEGASRRFMSMVTGLDDVKVPGEDDSEEEEE